MATKAKQKKAKYKVGQTVLLKNQWALSLDPNGLNAKVLEIRTSKQGEIFYKIEAQRPPVPLSTLESDLEKISE